jgi:hypothetical protein
LVSFMVLKALDFRNQENPTEEKREKSFWHKGTNTLFLPKRNAIYIVSLR